MVHHRQVAREIKDEYVDTISKVYFSYFKSYISKLAKLQVMSLCYSLSAANSAINRELKACFPL